MAGFRKAWDAYRASLGDERWLQWIKRVALVDERAKASVDCPPRRH
jgi:hypothetical protein